MIIGWWHLIFRSARSERPGAGRFAALADAVSYGMGTPLNISIWTIMVLAWFALFIINPHLQDTSFLPSWFTSNAFNFPLNTITTLAELFIGFLIAAAANRVEKRNWELHQKMAEMLQHLEAITATEQNEIVAEEAEIGSVLEWMRKLDARLEWMRELDERREKAGVAK